jgi:two-component system invasion response regulator UvrY
MKPIRVVIADDHPLIILGLTPALAGHNIKVIDQVTTAEQILAKYAETRPDVLVLDIRFGEGLTGLDVAGQILQRFADARIVFYSQFDQDETISEAYRLGGTAFIPKNTTPALLAEAIKKAHAGQIYFLPHIAERLALIGLHGEESPQSKLDPRELEVFKMMARGFTNAEIGETLNLTARTISNISSIVKEKLGVTRQAEITLLAVKHLMIEP